MKIIKRDEWGALPNKYPFKKHIPSKITIHNIGSSETPIIDKFKMYESIQSIDEYHVKTRGWNAIGYHYIIAPNGDIYEGRPDNVVGAHVKNNNTGNIGINVYCNSNVEIPTKEQIDVLKQLLFELTNKYNIKKSEVYGHYQLGNTDCPGANIKRLLPLIIDTFDKKDINNQSNYIISDRTKILMEMKKITTILTEINDKLLELVKQI